MLFGNLRVRLRIDGIMPERALLRIKRAKIPLYNVKKREKTRLDIEVKRKDLQKVFAIYPNVCYNSSGKVPYTVRKTGGVGLTKAVEFCKNRVGLLLGALLFGILTLSSEGVVLGVDIVGGSAYEREALRALEESGIKKYAIYPKGREDAVTAKLLALDGVEFCSVKKIGRRVRVEIRLSPFATDTSYKGSMQAKHAGTVVGISVLRGFALKKVGDEVAVGETLVGNWFCLTNGEQVRVEPIARVRIACEYAYLHVGAADEESAFAAAYLDICVTGKEELTQKSVVKAEEGFEVKISYVVTETVNL